MTLLHHRGGCEVSVSQSVRLLLTSSNLDLYQPAYHANLLSDTPTAKVVEWVRNEVRKRVRAHTTASERQLYTGFTAGWPDFNPLAAVQAAKKRTTWQAVVRRSIPAVLGIIA